MGKTARRGRRSRRRSRSSQGTRIDRSNWTEDPRDELLSRFIKDEEGNDLGESIGVEGQEMIMKQGAKFFIIPMNHIRQKTDHLEFHGKINWKAAEIKGERWRKRSLDIIKVTEKLRTT